VHREPFFKGRKKIRWGIIGCGNVTEVKSGPAYKMTEGFELAMVMRRNGKKAEDYAKRHHVPHFTTDAAELIEHPDIDAVYIATPPDSHKAYGLWVAEAGKPCCIEKPMSPSYAESLEIYEAFHKKKLPLYIAYYRRSLPRFNQLKQWLDEERIGAVRHIKWLKARTASTLDQSGAYNWRTDANIAPAGYFDDLASHGLDLFCYLLGDIKEASGHATNQQGLYTAMDAITGSWIHENGVIGSGSWVFGAHEAKDEVHIYGSKGEIRFSVLDERPIELFTSDGHESLMIAHPEHLHQYHVAHMQQHLFGGIEHPSTGKTGLHTSWVMDKILGNP